MRRMRHTIRILALLPALALVVTACGGTQPSTGGGSKTPVTITVWDYYGQATPVKPAIAGFEKAYPWITVKYSALDWDTAHEKFPIAVSSNAAPDVATLDMTWLPVFASKHMLADLSALSGGKLNGQPITTQYAKGALQAMSYQGHYVAMLYDFDVYSLYYRSDLLRAKGIAVPRTWDQLLSAAKKLAVISNGKTVKSGFEIGPETFHWSQFLYQNGGTILTPDNARAAFNSPQGVAALAYDARLLHSGGIYWGTEQGDPMAGVKDGRIAMFNDGPYWMGLLKSGAPELKGKWGVAPAPYSAGQGSYLGGTGLAIPVNAPHPEAAWLFTQYLLQLPQQLGVAKYAGAAPATLAALRSPVLTKPDPYFGGQAPFKVFMAAMQTAHPFPYVKQWNDIDTAISDSVAAALLGKQSPQNALNAGAAEVNTLLGR